ncbi:MAG: zinc transport system permease protein [Flavobacteriales bacterium]|jgi:zinc transport system permease protein
MLSVVASSATMIELFIYPLIAGLLLCSLTGPLGSFVVWQRMSYFGETIAHASLIGASLGILLNIDTTIATICVCASIALVLAFSQMKLSLANDTLLGIVAHGSLAIGLLIAGSISPAKINVYSLLMGDLLSVGIRDILTILILSLITLVTLKLNWRALLLYTIDAELAAVEGHNIPRLRLLIALLTALTIAVSIKVVGVLLVSALLIIPAAASRRLASSPEAMVVLASIFGMLSVIAGLFVSAIIDIPAGPTIVVCSLMAFVGGIFIKAKT